MKSVQIKTDSFEKTQEFAQDFAKNLKAGSILCLYGELGTGKTTFAQGLAKGLGVIQRIISPTFIIVREYKVKDLNFYHIDLYRTQTRQDLQSLGLEEILSDPENIVAIEWAEKLGDMLPDRRFDLTFKLGQDDTREINIEEYE